MRQTLRQYALFSIALCCLLTITFLQLAYAQTNECKIAVLVGKNFDLSTNQTIQRISPAIAYNSVGNEYMVVWIDSRNPGTNDIFGQLVSATGAVVGANIPIIEFEASQNNPSIVHNSRNNEYLVAWMTQHSGAFNHGYGRLLAANGSVISNQFFISNGGLENSLAYNPPANEYFYEGRNFFGDGPAGIRGQRISGDGNLVGPNIGIATTGDPAPAGQVAYNPNANEYLATWRDQVDFNLKGQRISADGVLLGNAIVIATGSFGGQSAASIAFDPKNNRYLAVFVSSSGISGQFISSSGELIGSNFLIIIRMTGSQTSSPMAAYNNKDNVFLVVWVENVDVKGQLLLADGSIHGKTLMIARKTGSIHRPGLAFNSKTGEFLTAWVDNRNIKKGEQDIFAQLVSIRRCMKNVSINIKPGSPDNPIDPRSLVD
jgi:hypothetical protein